MEMNVRNRINAIYKKPTATVNAKYWILSPHGWEQDKAWSRSSCLLDIVLKVLAVIMRQKRGIEGI